MIHVHPVATGVRIQTSQGDQVIPKGLRYVLNAMCLASGSTYEGRIQAAKVLLQQDRLVPLYVNPSVVLIFTHSIRRFECVAYNIFALDDAPSDPFLTSQKGRNMVENALKVHQYFSLDYDTMKYLKGHTTNEEKNIKRPYRNGETSSRTGRF